MIPNSRLDALTDGVFAFAMTLLVIDLRLPDSFAPTSAMELLKALAGLHGQLLAYLISFWVLGLRWLAIVRQRIEPETVSLRYAEWSLAQLFFITFVPFSTMVIGRYPDYAPAVWLYAANMILAALISLRLATMTDHRGYDGERYDRRMGLVVIIVVALLSVAVSFVNPRYAMWAYLLNAMGPAFTRWLPGRSA